MSSQRIPAFAFTLSLAIVVCVAPISAQELETPDDFCYPAPEDSRFMSCQQIQLVKAAGVPGDKHQYVLQGSCKAGILCDGKEGPYYIEEGPVQVTIKAIWDSPSKTFVESASFTGKRYVLQQEFDWSGKISATMICPDDPVIYGGKCDELEPPLVQAANETMFTLLWNWLPLSRFAKASEHQAIALSQKSASKSPSPPPPPPPAAPTPRMTVEVPAAGVKLTGGVAVSITLDKNTATHNGVDYVELQWRHQATDGTKQSFDIKPKIGWKGEVGGQLEASTWVGRKQFPVLGRWEIRALPGRNSKAGGLLTIKPKIFQALQSDWVPFELLDTQQMASVQGGSQPIDPAGASAGTQTRVGEKGVARAEASARAVTDAAPSRQPSTGETSDPSEGRRKATIQPGTLDVSVGRGTSAAPSPPPSNQATSEPPAGAPTATGQPQTGRSASGGRGAGEPTAAKTGSTQGADRGKETNREGAAQAPKKQQKKKKKKATTQPSRSGQTTPSPAAPATPSRVQPPPAPTTKVFKRPVVRRHRLDFCLHWGRECGEPAATAFCRAEGFRKATRWKVAEDIGARTPTYVLGDRRLCRDPACDGFATITCSR